LTAQKQDMHRRWQFLTGMSYILQNESKALLT
jgi:hypothetical protein